MTDQTLSWREFTRQVPTLAAAGESLLFQFGVGLGYLATVRKDGGPRVHPVCPIITNGGLYLFVLAQSPKRYDLLRDSRFALHAFPAEATDDEFYCSGVAAPVADNSTRSSVARLARHDVAATEQLFELSLSRALHTTWNNPRQADTTPNYDKWASR